MPMDYSLLEQQVDAIPQVFANELQKRVSERLDKCGLYYRAFSRRKSSASTIHKMRIKQYDKCGKKMQDLIGVRLALYFKDDVDICVEILKSSFSVIEEVRDLEKSDKFSPMRLNLVCKIPDDLLEKFSHDIWNFPIDKTFEVQIRTVFSEGWHEVEHDLRYKNQEDWENHTDLSRNLNGIFATLETCDWAILNVFDTLAYQKYKNSDWESMLRNHLRIHFEDTEISPEIIELFNSSHDLVKDFFKVDRKKLLLYLSHEKMVPFPKKMNNIIYIINELMIQNEQLSELTPPLLKENINPMLKEG